MVHLNLVDVLTGCFKRLGGDLLFGKFGPRRHDAAGPSDAAAANITTNVLYALD